MRIFTQEIIVAPQHIDIQKRVSNLCYVQWMQDLAINHSTVQGWGVERYEAEGHGWVVRQHTITYKRPALAGDVITAATWVAELASRQSLRRYLFWRAADRSVLAEAATVWVYIDMATGRPSRFPAIGLRGRDRRQGSLAAPAGLADGCILRLRTPGPLRCLSSNQHRHRPDCCRCRNVRGSAPRPPSRR